MAWFRIDDGFYNHPKVLAAGNAATGLWVRCGAWSSAYGTDGLIPPEVVRTMGSRREIDSVIAVRLWLPTDEGMLMPDFLDYNPSKADSDRRRKIDAERKRRERSSGAEAVDHDPATGRFVPRHRQEPYA